MNHIMLDLETLGTKENAVIVSIGAVFFDADNLGDKFYTALELGEQIRKGRTVSGSTIEWWMKQSTEARSVFSETRKFEISEALNEFAAFCGKGDVKVWGNGAMFDNAILLNAYEQFGIKRPWSYRNDRCYRTVIAEFKDKYPDVKITNDYGVAHNALDDAIAQAHTLQAVWRLTK